MVINGRSLLFRQPIKQMVDTKVYDQGVSYGLGEAGYDVRIKQDITFTRGIFGRRYVEQRDWYRDELKITRKQGRFALASAVEEFDIPNNLVGIVHDKSTWARRGLSVFNTVAESGWKGFLTLELVYHGQGTLHIPAGSGIAQVVFHHTCNPATYTGRYNHQADRPVEAITAHASAILV